MSTCLLKTNNLMDSVRGVTQIELKVDGQNRVVTILGELHNHGFKCSKGRNISIYDYCIEREASNKNCMFILEYNSKEKHMDRIGSEIIQEVFSGSSSKVRSKCIGLDSRQEYITRDQQSVLYNEEDSYSRIYTPNIELTKKHYIEPYISKGLPKINNPDFNIEMGLYIKEIEAEFFKLNDKSKISQLDLKWLWCRVMDYYILNEIIKKGSVDEYVIVLGENHRRNITSQLENWDDVKILKNESGKTKHNCVETNELSTKCV